MRVSNAPSLGTVRLSLARYERSRPGWHVPVLLIMTAAYLVVGMSSLLGAADWDRFRGVNGSGVAEGSQATPTKWDSSTNIKWRVDLPGPGSSSPIVVGNRVFVTCWSGYGIDRENPGDQGQLKRHLICLDRANGKIHWDRTVEAVLPEDEYRGMFAEHGYATHTPASDGKHVFVYFGKSGALAFDMDGKQLWQTKLGTESDPRGWGSASSPVLYKDFVIVTASAESESLVALNKSNGEVVWRQEAAGLSGLWGTPVLVGTAEGRTDLVLGVPMEVWGMNPETGKLRWYCTAMETDSFCSSVVADGDVVYAIEGRAGGSIAVRVGGHEDVSESHVVWRGDDVNRIGTPVLYQGRLFSFSGGMVNCVDAATGKRLYRARLKDDALTANAGRGFGGDYSSPIVADGKVYFVTRGGNLYVLSAGAEFEQLAVNRVTPRAEDFSATPAASDGELFVRSDKRLYCIAEGTSTPADPADAAEPAVAADGDRPGAGRRGRGGGGPGGPGGFDLDEFFKQRDANQDGKLAEDEISERMRENLPTIDTDKDGSVTLEEFKTGLPKLFARGGGGGPGGRRGGYDRNLRQGKPDRPQRPELES